MLLTDIVIICPKISAFFVCINSSCSFQVGKSVLNYTWVTLSGIPSCWVVTSYCLVFIFTLELILDTLDVSSYLDFISCLSNQLLVCSEELVWFGFPFNPCVFPPCFVINKEHQIYPNRSLATSFSCHSLHECPRWENISSSWYLFSL